jgi:hypothetical protein
MTRMRGLLCGSHSVGTHDEAGLGQGSFCLLLLNLDYGGSLITDLMAKHNLHKV